MKVSVIILLCWALGFVGLGIVVGWHAAQPKTHDFSIAPIEGEVNGTRYRCEVACDWIGVEI